MLGIDFSLNVKSVRFPIYFDYTSNNTCTHCGSMKSLVMVDKFGRITKEEIHPFDHIECTKCGQKYTIKWIDNGSGRIPYTADPSIARQFTNYFANKISKFLGK